MIYRCKDQQTVVAVLSEALSTIGGDNLVAKALVSRLKKAGVYRGGQGHAGTTQLRVPMNINGKHVEKPRFWLFNRDELMQFGREAARDARRSKAADEPRRARGAVANTGLGGRRGRPSRLERLE